MPIIPTTAAIPPEYESFLSHAIACSDPRSTRHLLLAPGGGRVALFGVGGRGIDGGDRRFVDCEGGNPCALPTLGFFSGRSSGSRLS